MPYITKEKLIALLHAPEKTGQAVDLLGYTVRENPYFHTVHQLYIKGLQQTSPAKMEQKLGVAAISVRDRVLLCDYLNNPDLFRQRVFPIKDSPADEMPVEAEKAPAEAEMTQTEAVAEKPPEKVAEKPAEKVESKEKKVVPHSKLIDAFLTSNPKIIPGESGYVVDLSESEQDITDIGTETLADIYAMQGNKEKAIEIYEKLILKYPEKNIYFAAQIKRLK